MVLTTTIDKYCHILFRRMPPFLGSKYLVFYSKMEKVQDRELIEHPGVRECLKFMNIDEPLEINHAGDLPARSGLRSSSAFTVGMLHACYALLGKPVHQSTLANEAIKIEKNILRENGGVQDQIECALGGINVLTFNRDETYTVQHIDIGDKARWFEQYLVLVYTDRDRLSSDISKLHKEGLKSKHDLIREMMDLVPLGAKVLKTGTPVELGELLHETWMMKRELSAKVSDPEIDAWYETARHHGAIGGKILGAGAGGFILLCVPPDRRDDMLKAIGLQSIPVKFEHRGSHLVLNEQ